MDDHAATSLIGKRREHPYSDAVIDNKATLPNNSTRVQVEAIPWNGAYIKNFIHDCVKGASFGYGGIAGAVIVESIDIPEFS